MTTDTRITDILAQRRAIAAQGLPLPSPTAPAKIGLLGDALENVARDWLTERLTSLERDAESTIRAVHDLITPPFTLAEVWNLGVQVRSVLDHLTVLVSQAVAVDLPGVRGGQALTLVQATVQDLMRRRVAPLLPNWIYPSIEGAVLGAVEMIYQTRVRPGLKGLP